MTQLLRGRRFKFDPHCHPVLLLTVTTDISKNNCGFDPFCAIQTKDARICAELHRELPAALWSLEFYRSIILNLCQQSLPSDSLDQGNSTSKRFWRAIYHLKFLDSPASNQEIFVSLNHPNHSKELRPSQAASQHISFTCLAVDQPKEQHIYLKNCSLKKIFVQNNTFFPSHNSR